MVNENTGDVVESTVEEDFEDPLNISRPEEVNYKRCKLNSSLKYHTELPHMTSILSIQILRLSPMNPMMECLNFLPW